MLYAERDEKGEIVAIRRTPLQPGQDEATRDEVVSFLARGQGDKGADSYFSQQDKQIIRVLDDLIDLLVAKNVILFTELPEAAQKKLNIRKDLRQQIRKNNSFVVDDII